MMDGGPLSLAPMPVRIQVLSDEELVCIMPSGDFILIICAPPGSGQFQVLTLLSVFFLIIFY